jgi:hypothetical protein
VTRLRSFVVVCAGLVLLSGCIHDIPEIPSPPPTKPTTTTTGYPDFSDAELRGVAGTTTTSVPMQPGEATLTGIVTAPDGFVPGAQVLVERLVGGGVGSMTLVTGADGKWALPGVLGGRYRVRAWRAPDLAVTGPYALYIEAKQTVDLPVRVESYRGLVAVPSINPDPPVVHEAANLVVQIATRRVDEQGIVIADPVPDVRLELYGGSAWQMQSSNPTTADNEGRGRWQVACAEAGHQPLSVVVSGDQPIALALPDCALTPPTTSTSVAGGSSSTGRSTSTTSRTSTTSGSGPTTTQRSSTSTSRSTSTTAA